jgi:hypothetical protein
MEHVGRTWRVHSSCASHTIRELHCRVLATGMMAFNPLFPLSHAEAQEIAGCLLTSSAIERYIACLKNCEATKRLMSEMKLAHAAGSELLTYGWFYRARLLESIGRSEWEIPASVILYVLGHSGIAGTEQLLQSYLLSHQPQMQWLAGLSRRLLAIRAGSQLTTRSVQERLISLSKIGTISANNAVAPEDGKFEISRREAAHPGIAGGIGLCREHI